MFDTLEISKRLKEKRLEKGFKTQREFANAININPSTLSAYEKGNKIMTLDHLTIICAKLECSLDWMMYGTNKTPVQVTISNESIGEQIAKAFITLIDNNIISTNSKVNGEYSNAFRTYHQHSSFAIYINDYEHPISKDFFNAYYTSVKCFKKSDENRKSIAESLKKSFADSLNKELK